MVRVKNPPPGGRATRRPGRFLTKPGRGETFIAQTWPRKRGPIKSEEQKETARQFALAQKAANEAFSWNYIEAENMSQGTIWNRREMLVKAAQGNLFEFRMDDGEFYGNWFVLAKEIQALLDTITDEVGTLLVRSGDGWAALMPGADGYYLQSNGPDFLPAWNPVSEPSPSFEWSTSQPFGDFTGSDFTAGSWFSPAIDAEVSDVAFQFTNQSGGDYEYTIAETNSTATVTAILQKFSINSVVAAQGGNILMPLPTLQTFERGKYYHVGVTKLGSTPTGSILMKQSRGHQPPLPFMGECFISRKVSGTLAVGNAMNRTGQTAHLQMKFREL